MRHFDLVVIGAGSGNTVVDDRFSDRSVAIIEPGPFGGTCLNVGCIPSKMYVHPADLARTPARAAALGVDLRLDGVRWPDIRDRIFGRIDTNAEQGRTGREQAGNITVFGQRCRFVGPRRLLVGDEEITADRVVVAAGSRPVVPDIPGLDTIPYATSDTVMRLAEQPRRLAVLGGGYIAAEFANVFSAFGTEVTVLNQGDTMLPNEDEEVAARFTEQFARRVDVRLKTELASAEPGPDGGVRLHLDGPGGPTVLEADVLLVATGRVPNADTLDPEEGGLEVDEKGRLVVDEYQRTTAEGVFALGDVSTHTPLKHVANEEARTVQHNLLHPDALVATDRRPVPHAVFSDPQIAAIGLTEADAREQGLDIRVGRTAYADVAFGWALEDTDSFVKIILDAGTGLIAGAHLLGPQASTLIQPLVQAMTFGQRAEDVAHGQYWIHPALTEVVENALLAATAEDA